MYLKKIIAQGFKSFADNTIIDLEKNITGVVGPNGSGKSNVVDAVRWVLGEQSVKSLRGDGNMTDVIFAGSKSRNSMGVASVTLVFDNADNYLPISHDEVSIKRRLYKDGTNEFYINTEKVRLKDVVDLLMDSGIGKESFNIISQGKIEEILSNKPAERRVIFEEAAGVLKYKKRKEEALRKLDKTHDNMSRVTDIIKELETQVEPLREQKRKALEYFEIASELEKLEVALVTDDITSINDKYQNNKKKIEVLNEEISKISTDNTKFEARIEEYKVKQQTINDNISNLQKELLELTTKAEKINSQKEILLERKKYEVDDIKLHNNILELKESELKYQNELNSYKLELNNILDIIEELLKKQKNKENEISDTKTSRDIIENKLTISIRNQNILKTKITSLEDSIDNNNSLPYSVKNVLNNPKLNGIHNTIGKIIDIEEKYVKSIGIALGASSNHIVVDNENSAKNAITYLKNNSLGRATFFPLNVIKGRLVDSETLQKIKREKGFIDLASNLVKYDSKYTDIIQNQLGNVLVVDNIDNANVISKNINYRYRIVTLDGELLHVGGSLTGGDSKQKNPLTEKYELQDLQKELNKLESDISSFEVELNKYDNLLKALEDEVYLVDKERISKEEEIKEKNKRIDEYQIKINDIKSTIDGTNNILNDSLSSEEDEILKEYYQALDDKNKVMSKIDSLTNDRNKVTNELEEFEYSVKKDNSLYNQKNKELKELEIEVNRSDVKLDNLLNLLNESYNMTYEHAKANYTLDMDTNLARNKVNSYKRQIKELGAINPNAPEEYDKISGRYEFLIKQQQDLTEAENTLLEIIKEMDTVMEVNFKKAFLVINEHFTTTFKELFKGGTASLKLTDPNNLLETGIEIIASPPGKSLKSISLLSGGEKTFTAISLLFAILKSRPVPFCILDEVEAALDEVNVESFGEYLQGLKNKTQFLLITHKKKTMEFVDTLYGITMQESGVSKLVSVKLEELDENK
jgi:Chromosome segregation ATPases